MAQMAPALADAAGSATTNGNISSSSVQNPFKEPYVEERVSLDNSKPHINSTTSKNNGFYRSMANSNIKTTAGKRVLDDVHNLNNLPRAFPNAPESAKSRKLNSQSMSPNSRGENASVREEIRPISSQKEALLSTPTRIPITTTKTCGPNSLENRSSCQALDNKTNDESEQRHLFPCPQPSPRVLLDKKVKKVGLNQSRLAARARKLERRLRTLQSRHLETHVTEQLQTFALNRRKTQQGIAQQKQEQARQDLHSRQSNQVKEESSTSQTPIKSSNRVGDELPSNASSGQNSTIPRASLPENHLRTDCDNIIKPNGKESDGSAARSLVCQLELAEHVADSDATESSSGAESSDEMEYNLANSEPKTKGPPSHLNQFYSERGNIASKWTWLRSQVIDIERRIRRCEETYKAVRLRKTPINLEKQKHAVDNKVIVSMASKSASDLLVDTANMLNHRKAPANLGSSIMTASKIPENAFPQNSCISQLTEKDKTNLLMNVQNCSIQHDSDHINSCTAARTRAVQKWQERKLFDLSKIHKPSASMLCSCGNLWTPCVLCKRSSPSLPKLVQRQDLKEKVALVDLSFHPVLSFETEIPLSLHFGALLKKGNFQSRIFKLNPPNDTKTATKRKYVRSASSPAAIKKKERKEALEYKKQGKLRNLRDRKNRKKAASASKNERTLRQKSRGNAKRPAAVNAGLRLASQLQKRARSLSLPSGNSRPTSPGSNTPSPTSFGHSFPVNALSAKKKKLTSNAFDINNIVIPYSMASTTRVEKLQYKEILTPAWREVAVEPKEEPSITDVKEVEDEEMEDLSNLSFALRHLKCEENERKRFIGLAIQKKKRSSTRQNSEATTPEPVSPGSLLFDGHLTESHNSSGVPSPTSSNPSLNSSLNISSPTGLSGAVVNMISSDSMPSKLERSGKSSRHHSNSNSNRRSSSVDQNEDSNEAWPVVAPWPLRNFPLTEIEVDHLNNPPPTPISSFSVPASPSSSRTASPILSPVDSLESTAAANWTVKLLSPETANNIESDSKPPRKGIVLKLAKR